MKYTVFLLSFTLLTCSPSWEKEFQICINDSIETKEIENSNFNLFETSLKFEKFLIENKILQGSSKQDYLELLELLRNNNLKLTKDIQLEIESSFSFPIYTRLVFSDCPKKILRSKDNYKHKDLLALVLMFDNLRNAGLTDLNEVGNFVMSLSDKDLGKDVYKTPLVILINLNLYQYCCGEDIKALEKKLHPDSQNTQN